MPLVRSLIESTLAQTPSLGGVIRSSIEEMVLLEFDFSKTWATYQKKLDAKIDEDDTFVGYGRKDWGDFDEEKQADLLKDIYLRMQNNLAEIDPTPNKEYHRWLMQVYANSAEHVSWYGLYGDSYDWPSMTKALQRFHDLKKIKALKGTDADILKVPNWKIFREVLAKYAEIETDKNWLKNGTKVIYQDEHCQVVQPLTYRTSHKWGSGTQWCTAADSQDGENYFKNYTEGGRRLYIFIPKHEGAAQKYQASMNADGKTASIICNQADDTRTLSTMSSESKGVYDGALEKIFGYSFAAEKEKRRKYIEPWLGKVIANNAEDLLSKLSMESFERYDIFTEEFADLWVKKLHYFVRASDYMTVKPNPIQLQSTNGRHLTDDDLYYLHEAWRQREYYKDHESHGIKWTAGHYYGSYMIIVYNPPAGVQGIVDHLVAFRNRALAPNCGKIIHHDLTAYPKLRDLYHQAFDSSSNNSKRLDYHPYLKHLSGSPYYGFLTSHFRTSDHEPPLEFMQWVQAEQFSSSYPESWERAFNQWLKNQEVARDAQSRAHDKHLVDVMADEGGGVMGESVVRKTIEVVLKEDSPWVYPGLCEDNAELERLLSPHIDYISPHRPKMYKGDSPEFGYSQSRGVATDTQDRIIYVHKKVRLSQDVALVGEISCTNRTVKSGTYQIHTRLVSLKNELDVLKVIGDISDIPLPSPYPRDSSAVVRRGLNDPLGLFVQELERVYRYAQMKWYQNEERNSDLGDLEDAAKVVHEHFGTWSSHNTSGLMRRIEPHIIHHEEDGNLMMMGANMFRMMGEWGTYAFGGAFLLGSAANDVGAEGAGGVITVTAEIMEEDDTEYRLSIGVGSAGGNYSDLKWVGSWLLPLSRASYDIVNQVEKWARVFYQNKWGGVPHSDHSYSRHGMNLGRVESCIESVLLEATAAKTWEIWGKKVLEIEDDSRPTDEALIFQDMERADPTPTHTYLPWLMKTYIDVSDEYNWRQLFRGHNIEVDLASSDYDDTEDYQHLTINDVLGKYHTLKTKNRLHGTEKDINRLSLQGLADVISNGWRAFEMSELEKEAQKSVKKVLDNSQWLVVQPMSHAAACVYGAGTKWCTASRDSEYHFNSYSKSGTLYIIINRNTDEKMQAHVQNGKLNLLADEEDSEIDVDRADLDDDVLAAMGVKQGPTPEEITHALNSKYHESPYDWSERLGTLAKPPFSVSFVGSWYSDLDSDDRQSVIYDLDLE